MNGILCVAEKPSAAKEITNKLTSNYQTVPSLSKFNPTYLFNYLFNNVNTSMYFTSVTGHITELKFHEKYKNWDSCTYLHLLT